MQFKELKPGNFFFDENLLHLKLEDFSASDNHNAVNLHSTCPHVVFFHRDSEVTWISNEEAGHIIAQEVLRD